MSEISNNNEYIPRAERRNKDGLTEKEFLEQYNPGHYASFWHEQGFKMS